MLLSCYCRVVGFPQSNVCDVERRESNDTVFCPFFLLSSAHSEAACSVRRFPLIMIRMLWGVYVSTSWLRDTPSNTAMHIREVFWFNDKYSLSISFSYTWIWIFASHTKVIIYMIFKKKHTLARLLINTTTTGTLSLGFVVSEVIS